MAKAAHSPKVKAAFEKHEGETEGRIERLEQVFELIGAPARGKKCDAIEGIVYEGKEIMQKYKDRPRSMPVCSPPKRSNITKSPDMERSRAGHKKAVALLDQKLQQEKKTAADLTKISETAVNAEAE
jgi:ferritin-like metal-binding protein YciE